MSIESFIRALHDNSDLQGAPPAINWRDAPLPYKLYRDVPTISLNSDIPLQLPHNTRGVFDLDTIGFMLWYAYGITSCYQTAYAARQTFEYRRFAPSGGGLYPGELYMYCAFDGAPSGVYHYDAAHHRLDLLREGQFDDYLNAAAGRTICADEPFAYIFITSLFWKNIFKYRDFAYRLQGLDIGALIGQLLAAAQIFGCQAAVCYQYLDRSVNHLLGLAEGEESVYAIIVLSRGPLSFTLPTEQNRSTASDLCRQLPLITPAYTIRSHSVGKYPNLLAVHDAALLEDTRLFRRFRQTEQHSYSPEHQRSFIPLTTKTAPLQYDRFAAACRNRYSPDVEFMLRDVGFAELSTFIQDWADHDRYVNDLDEQPQQWRNRLHLNMCLYRIDGIHDGAYRYDVEAHALLEVKSGDLRQPLQQAMTLHNVNLFQVPLVVHIVGDRKHYRDLLGVRGYRVQQMEAGRMLQRLLLAASAQGWAGRPLLGFDTAAVDDIYRLTGGLDMSLLQVPIGTVRSRPQWNGSLHS